MARRTMKGGAKVPKSQSSRRSRGIHRTVNKVRAATLRGERSTIITPSENLRRQIAEREASEYEHEAAARAKFLKKGATLANLMSKKRSSSRSTKSVNRYSAAPSPSKSRASSAKKATKKPAAPTRRSAFGKDAFANMLAELGGIEERSAKYHASRGAKKGTLSAVRENNANNEM